MMSILRHTIRARGRISEPPLAHRNRGARSPSATGGRVADARRSRWKQIKQLVVTVYDELFRTRAFTVAAAMAFYFFLSLIPLLAIISALLGYLPIPHLFEQLLDLMAMFVPPDSMKMVEKIVAGVLTPHRGGLLWLGILGYLWSAT